MSSKAKLVTGPLSNDDKVYIVENYADKTVEVIAEKLKRNPTVVENYLKKINLIKPEVVVNPDPDLNKETEETFVTEKHRKDNPFVTRKGVATVFDGGESVPFKAQPTKNPFSTR